ncbi:MAG: cupredoxin domain-containing protein [Anaerolineales bacterium]|nr:cupredoxin domain-containing protein [Anaerolineales bacterium]
MKKNLFILLLLASLSLVACGKKTASTAIDVKMIDFQFQPNSFIVPAGQNITFTAVNNGAVEHDFVIMKLGTNAGPSFDDDDVPNVYWQVKLTPGEDVNASFTAPSEPGEYQVVCRMEGHIASGMVGKLAVVAAGN